LEVFHNVIEGDQVKFPEWEVDGFQQATNDFDPKSVAGDLQSPLV